MCGNTSGEKGINSTAVYCVKYAGQFILPLLIFKRKRYTPQLGAPLELDISEVYVPEVKQTTSAIEETSS